MKRGLILIITVLIISVSIVSVLAIETNLKSSYQPGETLIAEISGNFLDNLKVENILFYSNRLYIPLIYDLAKIQDKYYLYAILPEKERNYTLIIKNAHYYELGERIEDLYFNFSVQGNLTLFNVNPGFIITEKDFFIKVTPIKSLNLMTKFLNSTKETSIPIGQEKKIYFSVASITNFTFTFLSLEAENTKYQVPVAIFKAVENISLQSKLRFSKSRLNLTVLKDSSLEFEISLINTGQEDIRDIILESDIEFITIKPGKIDINAGTLEKINLTIKSEKTGLKEGKLKAYSENQTAELQLALTTIKDEEEFINNINKSDIVYVRCSDLEGKICKTNEECSVPAKPTSEGVLCCLGICKEKKSSGTGKIVAVALIIIALAIVGFFVYRRLRLKKTSSKELLKGKENEYEERFKPKEVKGNLTRF